MGQEIWPERHDPRADQRDSARVRNSLAAIRARIREIALSACTHEEFIATRCRIPQ